MDKRLIIALLLQRQQQGEQGLAELQDEIQYSLDTFYQDHISAEGAILDLLGVPKDNTVQTNACGIATKTGEWPEWAYCRDWAYELYDTFITQRHDIDGFIKAIESNLQEAGQ